MKYPAPFPARTIIVVLTRLHLIGTKQIQLVYIHHLGGIFFTRDILLITLQVFYFICQMPSAVRRDCLSFIVHDLFLSQHALQCHLNQTPGKRFIITNAAMKMSADAVR